MKTTENSHRLSTTAKNDAGLPNLDKARLPTAEEDCDGGNEATSHAKAACYAAACAAALRANGIPEPVKTVPPKPSDAEIVQEFKARPNRGGDASI